MDAPTREAHAWVKSKILSLKFVTLKKISSNGNEGNEDAAEEPAVNEDFSNYAEFLQLFMKLPTDVRHDIGHLLGPVNFTTLGEKISGLIVGCTYKGGSCMGQK